MMMDIVQKVLSAASHPSPNQKESFQAEAPPRLDPLTERELDVLRLMAAGHSNREIGEALVLAVGSVKWYASQIYSKLQVKNRTEAAAKARALDLL
jgi:LuxR family maltose regulon positive regulatory protein